MAKRKRDSASEQGKVKGETAVKKTKESAVEQPGADTDQPFTIQIITGSYDRVLHGVTATIEPGKDGVQFADTFLFDAHTSAIRCLALSPPSVPAPGQSQKVLLATGGTDERINVYNISAHPPSKKSSDQQLLSSIASRPILENSKNREVGNLMHHSSKITRLAFPTRSKLLSSAEDSTIAVTRTRDWSLLSTIKVPVPKVMGRPSGDTAPMGGTPSGVNDFAIHPSMKLMISVSKGERSMRLWNLVTGKKAGVLNFERDVLQEIGEGRHTTGEGHRVVWGSSPDEGDEFAVAFDREILVFGMDSKPRCRVIGNTQTKVHQLRYVKVDEESETTVLAVSTEDGRILLFSTRTKDLKSSGTGEKAPLLPSARLIAQLGGKEGGVSGRIKDFAILKAPSDTNNWYIVSGSSDGKIRLWSVSREDVSLEKKKKKAAGKRIGKLLGTYESHNRITCLEAFVMIPRPEGVEDSEDEDIEGESEEGSDHGSDEE
ncbi:Protein MAK11 [Pleurostoma richardsiae]|uniref:Protein MAK11 n=1 Tax=Pleurostoma richardsiae TaxID=41990 RepID=A0AA38S7G5_9PEZI|nr:Protein MAK11 [Pleurostoma richardsiae]